MRRSLLFVVVCAFLAFGFLALNHGTRINPARNPNIIATETVDGPIQNGLLVPSDGESLLSPAQRSPFFLQSHERVAVPEGPVDQVVRELTPRANSGDADAALGLYRKLDQCFSATHKEINAEQLAIISELGAGAQYEKQALSAQKDCISDGTSDFDSRGHWLERAAAYGSLEAQLIYATDIDAFFPTPSEMIRDPGALENYKRKSVRYMTDRAASGNIDSMIWLAGAYENGIMLERSPVNSYAYYRAADMAMPGIFPNEMISNLRARLPAIEQRHGDDLARSIHARCCS